jgi:hypothetical protein
MKKPWRDYFHKFTTLILTPCWYWDITVQIFSSVELGPTRVVKHPTVTEKTVQRHDVIIVNSLLINLHYSKGKFAPVRN